MEWIARELHADTKTVQHVFAKFDTLLSFCTQNGHIGFSPTLWTTITVFLKIIDRLKYDPKTWDTECKPSVTLTLQLTYSVPVMKCSRHFWHTYSNNVCFYSFIHHICSLVCAFWKRILVIDLYILDIPTDSQYLLHYYVVSRLICVYNNGTIHVFIPFAAIWPRVT